MSFKCVEKKVNVVSNYKYYLGLIFTEHLDYQITVKMAVESAIQALGLVIIKSNCYTKIYEDMIQSIINSGATIWGTREYSCIAAVYHRACRYFMGLGKYAPNIGVQGDMGLHLPFHHQWLCVTRQWCWIITLSNSHVNKKSVCIGLQAR